MVSPFAIFFNAALYLAVSIGVRVVSSVTFSIVSPEAVIVVLDFSTLFVELDVQFANKAIDVNAMSTVPANLGIFIGCIKGVK